MTPEQRSLATLNRLCKWRAFFAGWMLGTRPATDGPTRAARDLTDTALVMTAETRALARLLGGRPAGRGAADSLRGLIDARLTLRAEVSAVIALCIDRGLFTPADLNEQVAIEADYLAEALAARYPGFRATDDALVMSMPEAGETMRAEGFPP